MSDHKNDLIKDDELCPSQTDIRSYMEPKDMTGYTFGKSLSTPLPKNSQQTLVRDSNGSLSLK